MFDNLKKIVGPKLARKVGPMCGLHFQISENGTKSVKICKFRTIELFYQL